MGMRTRPKRAKGVVYERASDGYELMYIEKWVVRSNWIHTCKIRRYDNSTLPHGLINEMARLVCEGRCDDSAEGATSIEQVTQQLMDCTDGDMIYVVAWHDECEPGMDDVRSTVSGAHNVGHMGKTDVTTCDTSRTHVSHTHKQTTKVSKRRARRPTTSALSAKVWQEMRRHIAGRDQHDGVT
jgi:hypothetical protein